MGGACHVTSIRVLHTRHPATFLSLRPPTRAEVTQLAVARGWAWNLLLVCPGCVVEGGSRWIAGFGVGGGERCERIAAAVGLRRWHRAVVVVCRALKAGVADGYEIAAALSGVVVCCRGEASTGLPAAGCSLRERTSLFGSRPPKRADRVSTAPPVVLPAFRWRATRGRARRSPTTRRAIPLPRPV